MDNIDYDAYPQIKITQNGNVIVLDKRQLDIVIDILDSDETPTNTRPVSMGRL